MGFFKKKIFKEIRGGAWGHLLSVHKVTAEMMDKELRCVEREGVLNGASPVTFLRIFNLNEVQSRGVAVTGRETFDQNPDLVLFEGYLILQR